MNANVQQRRSVKEEIRVKMKALSWVRRRVEKLQEENERLNYQHQLIADFCKGFDWFRHVQLHALLADPEVMLAGTTAEQLTPGIIQQQLSHLLETEIEVQLLQQLSSLPVTQQQPVNRSASMPHQAAPNSSTAPAGLRDSSYSSVIGSEASPPAALVNQTIRGPVTASDVDDAAANAAVSGQNSTTNPCPASSSWSAAPPGDVWWLLKHALQQPWPRDFCNTPDDITVPLLIQHFTATAHKLSLQLLQHSVCKGPAEQAAPLRNMQCTLLQHFRIVSEVCACSHRAEMMFAVQLTNCATGEVLAEPNIERIVWVIDKLQLAQQQQQTIAQGSAVARKLLTPVMEELRELQLQQGGEDTCHYTSGMEGLSLAGDAGDDAAAAAGAAPSGAAAAADYYQQPMFSAAAGMPCSSRTSSSHTAGDAAGSNHDGGRHEDGSDGMQQQAAAAAPRQRYAGSSAYRRSLLLQQQRLDRMKLLMRKDSFLRLWFGSYLYGQLSWLQIARMHALMYPFYPVPIVFFSEVAANVAREEQQKQQHKQTGQQQQQDEDADEMDADDG